MRLYLKVAHMAFQRVLAYRMVFVSGILTNAFFALITCVVYRALYGAGGAVAGYTLQDILSYTWLAQALISIGAGWITDHDLGIAIRTGNVITDLMRPWSFFLYNLSRDMGERLSNMLLRGSLTYLIGLLYFGAHIPNLLEFLAFCLALILAIGVSFLLQFMVNLSSFWLLDSSGLVMFTNVCLQVFSGFIVPLAFFPTPLQRVAELLPFRAITSVPIQAFLGQAQGSELLGLFGVQLFWIVVMGMATKFMLAQAMNKVVIQGG
jgi:ABC-2 type transport system permease protein